LTDDRRTGGGDEEMRVRIIATLLGTMLLAAVGAHRCTHAPPPPPPAPPPEEAPVPPPPQAVWTAMPEVAVRHNGSATAIPRPLMRLDVDGWAADGTLQVACAYCEGEVRGSVPSGDVVWEPALPTEAVQGTIAEFALAVR